MARPSHRADPHALDTLLQNTLQLHHRTLHSSTTPSSPLSHHSPLHSAPVSPRSSHPVALADSLDSFSKRRPPKSAMRKRHVTADTPSAITSPARPISPNATFSPSSPPPPLLTLGHAPNSPPTHPWPHSSPTSPLRKALSSPKNRRHDPSFYDQLGQEQVHIREQPKHRQAQEQYDQTRSITATGMNTEALQSLHGLSQWPSRSLSPPRSYSAQPNYQQLQQYQQQSLQNKSSFTARQPRSSTGGMVNCGDISQSRFSHHPSMDPCHDSSVQQLFRSKSIGHLSKARSKTGYSKDSIDSSNGLGPKIDTTSVISIHVRYVPKDLWVQVDLPRNIPVHKARDIILAKCRLTFIPPQAHSTTPSEYDVPQSHRDRTTNSRNGKDIASDTHWSQGSGGPDSHHPYLSTSPGSSIRTQSSNELLIPTRSRRPSRAGMDDESSNDQESMDDEEAELQAEELMADDLFSETPSSRTSLGGDASSRDSVLKGLHDIDIGSPRLAQADQPQSHHSPSTRHPRSFSCNGDSTNATTARSGMEEHGALNHQQLQRLISYSLLHKSDKSRHSSVGGFLSGSGGKDGGNMGTTSRISSHIPGWSHYRSRQSSQNTRQMVREVLDHGGVLADSLGNDEMPRTETRISECSAWKACFGLFWVAAGHWLDDSRLISSYHLRPDCLLELQLRNNYIQLPPPGTSLSYYDHYAEGVLYKASKKSHRVATKLTGHGIKDSSGVWKERWVVLQGTKLLIYHKRKDTTKKSIELQIPLTVVTTVIAQAPRHGFKISSSTVPMSSTMITLTTSSDPNVPKVCFRATSESELNHWVRIFNSLNSTTLQGLPPPFDPSVMTGPIQVPPPLPPLPLEPPPVSLDSASLSTKKRDRHHSFTAAAAAAYGRVAVIGGIATGGFSKDRKRCHTTHGNFVADAPAGFLPTIDPVLISNAAAALSNLQGSDGGSETGASDSGSTLVSRNSTIQIRRADYGHSCVKTRSLPIMRSKSMKTGHLRDSTNSQSTLVGSLNGANLPQLQDNSLSRQTSWSSLGQSSGQGSGSESRYALGNQVPLDGEGLLMRHNMRSMRMRTVTEPGQAPSQASGSGQGGRILSVSSYRSSTQSLLKECIQRSKVNSPEPLSDAGSLPDESCTRGHKDVGPTCLLNPLSQALLNISNTRSSAPPLYTGYIWLYIPNVPSTSFVKEGEQPEKPSGGNASVRSSVSSISSIGKNILATSITSPTWPSGERMQSATTTGATNISITKASGRYVRCFVVINALGQFQWTETSKNDPLSPQQHQEAGSDVEAMMNPSYGIQLGTKQSGIPVSKGAESDNTKRLEDTGSVNRTLEDREGFFPDVQVSMAHKLRLYFFCIKITVSSLSEVMVELLDFTETIDIESQKAGSINEDSFQTSLPSSPQSPTPPIRLQNRFSTPLAHKSSSLSTSTSTSITSSSALSAPWLPSQTMSMTLQKSRLNLKTRHSVGHPMGVRMRTTTVATTTPGAVWPSMHPLFDRSHPPTSSESATPTPTPSPPLSKANVIQRTLSAPPQRTPEVDTVSITESEGSKHHDLEQGVPRSLLVKTQSLFVENRTRSKTPGSIFPTAAGAISSSNRGGVVGMIAHDGTGTGEALSPSKDGSSKTPLVVRTSGRMYGPESNVPAHSEKVQSPVLIESPKSTTSSVSISSNVLSLAQDLQKAMRKGGVPPSSGQDQQTASDTHSINGHKMTLQEITAKKRASAQRLQDEANVAAARLKLVGGLKALKETCDGDTDSIRSQQGLHRSEEDRASVKGRLTEKEQHGTMESTLRMLLKQCPFLEEGGAGKDAEERMFVTLKGYTETEDEWKKLQGALEQFLGGPIKDQRSALPPEDTLIPSYHAPRLPEFRLSDKARKFLRAKDRAAAAAVVVATTNVYGTLQKAHAATTTAAVVKDSADPTSSTAVTPALKSTASQRYTGDSSGIKPRSRVRSLVVSTKPVPASSSGSTVTHAPFAEFSRYSVQLASGVGYGPRKSFIDPGSSSSSSSSSSSDSNTSASTSQNNSPSTASGHFAEGYRAMVEENPIAMRLRSGSGSLMTGLESPSFFKARHQRTGSGNLLRSVLPLEQHQLTQGHTANGRGCSAMAQIKATSVNLTRWMQLATGSSDNGGLGDRNSLDMSRSSSSSKAALGMEGLYSTRVRW